MKKVKIKQGTRAWETFKESRIGSSEVFDLVRYYATDEELNNCGIDAADFKSELPFVSTWALYHKILNDGIYEKPLLDPELAEYGLAMEKYGMKVLQEKRSNRLRKGEVYASDNLIASLDISGISEQIDVEEGNVRAGEYFVCEQKTIIPFKKHLPLKYLIQAQYQITMAKAKFFILQAMILNEDTPFERGKIVALANSSKSKFFEYVKDKVNIQYFYFRHNEALSRLIQTCIERFFVDVKNRKEPTPYLESDSQQNIIRSIRENSFYNAELRKEYDLNEYILAKEKCDNATAEKQLAMQKIIEFSMQNNCSQFYSTDGRTASFTSNGRFLVKEPKL